jgi:5'-nucleotidase (lipoprotein e(P4) family)
VPVMRIVLLVALALPFGRVAPARAQIEHRELKWMRDSEEYATLMRQVYREATDQAVAASGRLPSGGRWAVVLDVDETALDNSVYQLELAAYGTQFDSASWNAWVRKARAPAVPGVVEFLEAVRAVGGRVAFITDRDDGLVEPTRRNLASEGLWRDGDLLCPKSPDATYTKRARRTELRAGSGRCAFPSGSVTVLAYLGDNMHDFPESDEEAGVFGERFFVLPNPSYGTWERAVTRRR